MGEGVKVDDRPGVLAADFDLSTYEEHRANLPFVEYVPYPFNYTEESPPLKPLREFDQSEMVLSTEQVGKQSDPSKVRLICINAVQLEPRKKIKQRVPRIKEVVTRVERGKQKLGKYYFPYSD